MTFDIYSDKSKRVIQRSAIRPARPEEGGFPNHRVVWDGTTEEEKIDENIKWMPQIPKSTGLTNKHKVKWHDTMEATADQADDNLGLSDAVEGGKDDFSIYAPNHEDLPKPIP